MVNGIKSLVESLRLERLRIHRRTDYSYITRWSKFTFLAQLSRIFSLQDLHKYPEVVAAMNLQFSIHLSHLFYSSSIEAIVGTNYALFLEVEVLMILGSEETKWRRRARDGWKFSETASASDEEDRNWTQIIQRLWIWTQGLLEAASVKLFSYHCKTRLTL